MGEGGKGRRIRVKERRYRDIECGSSEDNEGQENVETSRTPHIERPAGPHTYT